MEESDWDAVIAVHLRGHYCCTRPFAQYIREHNRTGCRIINFSSEDIKIDKINDDNCLNHDKELDNLEILFNKIENDN